MGEITGRQVFAVTAGAFGVIIAVNLVLAWKAVSTFPGLEVKNSYVAGQGWDDRRAAQMALGWTTGARYDAGRGLVALDITDAQGLPVRVLDLTVLLGRPTYAGDDRNPVFEPSDTGYVARETLGPGKWMMKVRATAPDGTPFEQRLELFVQG